MGDGGSAPISGEALAAGTKPGLGGGLPVTGGPAVAGRLTVGGVPAAAGGPAIGGGPVVARGPGIAGSPAVAGGPALAGTSGITGKAGIAPRFCRPAGLIGTAAGDGAARSNLGLPPLGDGFPCAATPAHGGGPPPGASPAFGLSSESGPRLAGGPADGGGPAPGGGVALARSTPTMRPVARAATAQARSNAARPLTGAKQLLSDAKRTIALPSPQEETRLDTPSAGRLNEPERG
jgi:hypothetical protein